MKQLVLVVDDDSTNRALARALLEGTYRVIFAPDGPTALAMLDREPVDIVLLDVMMPGMNGFDVCRAIKAKPAAAYLPVILITALSERSDRHQGLEAGADEFLTKPYERRELQLRVATFLRLRAQDQQIRAQLESLRQLDELKDDLVSLLVHDVRNPLASAMALLEAMETGSDPQLSVDIRSLQRQHERMRRLLDDVLTVRSLEDGALLIQPTAMSLAACIDLAVETCRPMAAARQVELNVQLSGAPVVHADASLVQRAIENLLSNAIKFAPKGSCIDIGAAVSGAGAMISIADRGSGIAPPVRQRLFERFETLAPRDANGPRGHGLGLYLVRLVASAHAGRVEAADRAGGGTIFTLYLPAAIP